MNASTTSTEKIFVNQRLERLWAAGRSNFGNPGMNTLVGKNNEDVDEVYALFCKSMDDVGGSSRAYGQLCCEVGQYLCFAMVCGIADVETVCEAGINFEAVSNSNFVVTFIFI